MKKKVLTKAIKKQEQKFCLRTNCYLSLHQNQIRFDFDDECKNCRTFDLSNIVKSYANYNMPVDFLYLFEDKKDTYEYQKIKEAKDKNNIKDLRVCYVYIYRELFVDDFILKYKDLKKQYRNILSKFESIVFGTKYAVDLLDVIDLPEVKTYIENQLKTDCTALSCVSKETIDFVKEYLNNDK